MKVVLFLHRILTANVLAIRSPLRKLLIPKAPCGKNFRIISGACELSREPVLSMRLHPLRTIAFIKIYLIFCIKSIVY
ncbi:MAG: hypothetical protein NC040_09245, partial [Muribaculaceae bacterium]|nr:hypothetical protein [Muribaculaceae bacterium]